MTEHSSAYSKLIGFINANGQEREFGGYYAPALDELLDWERDEAEDLIWHISTGSLEGFYFCMETSAR